MQAGFEPAELLDRLGTAGFEFVALGAEPSPLLLGGSDLLPEAPQLLVDRRHRGVGLIQGGQGLFGGVLTTGLLGERAGQGSR